MALRALTTTALIGSLLQAGCGGAVPHPGATRSSSSLPAAYADYPALRRRGPSGIVLVTPAQARAAAASASRPLWVGDPGGQPHGATAQLASGPVAAGGPDIASAREVARPGRARLWIARSNDGGVCVLSFRPELALDPSRYHAVSASCGSAAQLARGAAQVERAPGLGGAWLVSGVVPRGVTGVTLRLAGGRGRTLAVSDNSYSASVDRPVEGLAFVTGGVRH